MKNEIGNALEMVAEYEKATKHIFVSSITAIILGVLLVGLFAFGQIKADELAKASIELNNTLKEHEVSYLVSNIVDAKIELLRSEIKLRYHVSGVIGAAMLGVGIGSVFYRKKRLRQANAMRGLIALVDKDS